MTEPTSRPMSIAGPYAKERARLDGTFTDLDREWRKKYLKSQELGHHEPRTQFSASQMEMNPIRRAYRFPLDFLFSKLQPTLGERTQITRYWVGKYLLAGWMVVGLTYYFKYNSHDWSRKKGWMIYRSRSAVYPGSANFPNVSNKKPSDYADYGFKNSPI
ncbi:uncharacterized protein LOC116925947 [Daphnia magna]|uniref:Lethal (2) 35Di n=2 Tax=Daphnia magna TaxID=35525 RepID=A0A0P5NDF4_9CRUS|nr:uncharacterized protein LOC116925947 [Daphnia magna]KAK4016443.1 hypothetical protein OUZ56_031394 [Daphnia magna]KZS04258.1 Uncharacterized protein APZ42_032509 [Daphnia magna]